jgi:hypothetical protein
MTLKELAMMIQQDPQRVDVLLKTFKAENQQTQDFINSLIPLPVYIVPGMLEAFAQKYRETEPKKISDLMAKSSYIDSMFCIADGGSFRYLGISINGLPMCRMDNSHLVLEADKDTPIKWVF